jgi:NADPH:quinone reductase-like Zn-dependent oxidoreductase
MKAVVFERCGGREVLEYRDVPDPRCGADEALIEVKACGVNHLDLWVRGGLPGVEIEMPHILGNDVVGVVAEVGEVVRHVKPGDRVLVNPTLSCGVCPACLAGDDNLCRHHDVLGRRRNGGYAEQVAVPGVNCLPCPETLTWEQAAAVPLVFLTAWHMLFDRARLEAGEDVLVLAASSGVGSAAVQIAKLFHCRVIATAGGDAKVARALELGADHVIDHYRQDIGAEVKKITGRRGVDVVLEHVGAATWQKSLESLAPGGRVVTCGATTGYDVKTDLRFLFSKRQSLLGSFMGTLGDLHTVLKFVFRKQLKPVIDKVYPLSEIRAAHERLERKEQFGKVIVIP